MEERYALEEAETRGKAVGAGEEPHGRKKNTFNCN
jgi:hypothetical protein